MNFSSYQRAAKRTSYIPLQGPDTMLAPMLGLGNEVGQILEVGKKFLRHSIDIKANRNLLTEELGDSLWFLAAIATSCGIDLNNVARTNLKRTRGLYRSQSLPRNYLQTLPLLDKAYPLRERFPRRLVIKFAQTRLGDGTLKAHLTLVSADPNPFPNGPISRTYGGKKKKIGFRVGQALGDAVDDNTRRLDGYRFHDAIHMGFVAVLGWSPTLRALLGIKRRSQPQIDANEDGARAIYAEEGLAAILSRLAPSRGGFRRNEHVDSVALSVASATILDLEVEKLPPWAWRDAISQGFNAMHKLASNHGGYLVADLTTRRLTYSSNRPRN